VKKAKLVLVGVSLMCIAILSAMNLTRLTPSVNDDNWSCTACLACPPPDYPMVCCMGTDWCAISSDGWIACDGFYMSCEGL